MAPTLHSHLLAANLDLTPRALHHDTAEGNEAHGLGEGLELQQLERKEGERSAEIKPPPQQDCAAADKSPDGL